MAIVRAKRAATPARTAPAKRPRVIPKKIAKKAAAKPAHKPALRPLDISKFPPESIRQSEKWICLACVLDVFTRHMGLSLTAAHREIKGYTPALAEVSGPNVIRPYFVPESAKDPCPYCGSSPKWHARLAIYRIESGKATDALRREMVNSLPKSEDQFAVLEEKATGQHAFFDWLERISAGLNLDDPVWLREASRHYLSRKEPKTDWQAQFDQIHSIRRSRRLESGWEIDNGRLFLAPLLFDELLLVQYLLSRSHKAGGLTLEGRYTLPELFSRLRNAGYLRAVDVGTHNPGDALEQLLNYLSGGETALKFYYVVDRRDLLDKAKALKALKAPRPKPL